MVQIVANGMDPGPFANDPSVQALVQRIRMRHAGKVAAVLLYGSYLRGKRDGLLDFYVLLNDFERALPRAWHRLANRILPPNVYYLALGDEPGDPRCKYATLRIDQFQRLNSGGFHSYFWARFAQPTRLVWVLDQANRERIVASVTAAVDTFLTRVAPLMREAYTAEELWARGFAATYATELRAEQQSRGAELYAAHAQYFSDLLAAYAAQVGARCVVRQGQYCSRGSYPMARFTWSLRRGVGKLLSLLRLVKAAGTFDDPLDYILWKIERHSGIYLAPTQRQRRYPLLFAWPLLWRLYRRGAFR